MIIREKICERCGLRFPCNKNVAIGRWRLTRFCSKKCAAKIIHKGQIPWCLGKRLTEEHKQNISKAKKGNHYSPKTEIKKGQRISPETEFKIGNIPWNNDKKIWQGSLTEYRKIHEWVRKVKGVPDKCVKCGRKDKLHWSNISQNYKKIIEDWEVLCISHHTKKDMTYVKLK